VSSSRPTYFVGHELNLYRWWVNRYVLLRRNSGPLEPLYRFETTHSQVDQLYANDKVRAEARMNDSNVLPSNVNDAWQSGAHNYGRTGAMSF